MSGQRAGQAAGRHQATVGELPPFRHDPRILCGPQNAELFFHPDGEKGRPRKRREHAARQICAHCPLAQACAGFAARTEQPHGTWGGIGADQRTPRRKAAA